ncbi:MAG TPA: type II CAAX endopeptidase family protein [Polyangiales bacterium]|nr:type II CAAX endopeptidase family protein [Polyangiales bacterium]
MTDAWVKPLRAIGWLCAAVLLAYGGARVYALERTEVDFESPTRNLAEAARDPSSTRISARLAVVSLGANQRALFELCAAEPLDASRFEGAFELAVLQLERKQLMLRVPLDRAHLAHARTNSSGGCLLLGSGLLEYGGTYSVEAVFGEAGPKPEVAAIPLRVRVLSKTPLATLEKALVAALGLLLLLLIGLQLYAAPPADPAAADGVHGFSWADINVDPIAAFVASLALFGASLIPLYGPTLTLAKGVGLLSLQIALAWLLTRERHGLDRRQRLGWCRPARTWLPLLGAVVSLPALVGASMLALRLVPSTGEAPIQTFVSWPSGMLAAALLGVILPLGEEVFFRGYLYGALLGYGRLWSAAVNVIVFGSLHALQGWGNWGGLLGVFTAGLAFLGLRIASGSVLVACLLHVAYNLTLSLSSLRSADGG